MMLTLLLSIGALLLPTNGPTHAEEAELPEASIERLTQTAVVYAAIADLCPKFFNIDVKEFRGLQAEMTWRASMMYSDQAAKNEIVKRTGSLYEHINGEGQWNWCVQVRKELVDHLGPKRTQAIFSDRKPSSPVQPRSR
jgi:hypothetical protein